MAMLNVDCQGCRYCWYREPPGESLVDLYGKDSTRRSWREWCRRGSEMSSALYILVTRRPPEAGTEASRHHGQAGWRWTSSINEGSSITTAPPHFHLLLPYTRASHGRTHLWHLWCWHRAYSHRTLYVWNSKSLEGEATGC